MGRGVLLLMCPHDELVRELGEVVDEFLVHGRHGRVVAENQAAENLSFSTR